MWVVNMRTVIVDENEYQSERGLDIKIPGEYRVEDLQCAVALEGCQPPALAFWDGLFGGPSASLGTKSPRPSEEGRGLFSLGLDR